MIGAVNVRVAIRAAAVEILDRTERLRLRRMPAAVVAGIAHSRHTHLQELRVVAPVRFVAVRTVLHDGRVLPQEWPSTLRMAGQAVLVDCALYKLAWIRGAMRVVTARARHLAFPVWHVRRPLQLCPSHHMALQTQLRLLLLHALVFGKRGIEASL